MPRGHRSCGCDGSPAKQLVRTIFTIRHRLMVFGDRITAPLGLTASRWMLLGIIGEREDAPDACPVTIGELAEESMLSVQAVSRMLVAMERQGLVERATRPGRGRRVDVRLTPLGRDRRARAESLKHRLDPLLLRGFDDEQVARLQRDLERLLENVATSDDDEGRSAT